MRTDMRDLRSLAQSYFDAAYDMDADRFSSIFHQASSVTRIGDDGDAAAIPIAAWLATVRTLTAPRTLRSEREDEIVSIDAEGGLAYVKLKLRIPPRRFTDILSCLKIDGTWKIVQKVTACATD